MPAAVAISLVLGLLLVAAIVTVGVTRRRLHEALAEVHELRAALEVERASPRGPRTRQAAQAAGVAMRSVVETAHRVREQGVRGMLLSSIEDLAAWAVEDRPAIDRVAAADGTVTVMFSDIENSTALNSELGDEQWVKLLEAHARLVHSCVEKCRGHVVKNQGDGYMVVFRTPELAIEAARRIQRALRAPRQRSKHLRRTPIRVRVGLHTGTAIEREGDYFGRNIAMAARVAAIAEGGEILVTDEIATTLADRAELRFVRCGIVPLKGIPGEHQLWRVDQV